MESKPLTTRDRLVNSAARLFREKGYHGTGLSQILTDSKTPKGSLYHHFPNGKSDLAMSAASWMSQGMLAIIDDAFKGATTFQDGATTLCFKLAKLFDKGNDWQSCPISAMLFDDPDNAAFRQHADAILTSWIERTTRYATNTGMQPDAAQKISEHLLIAIQGAWTLARARRSSDIIRRIPTHLFD